MPGGYGGTFDGLREGARVRVEMRDDVEALWVIEEVRTARAPAR